jgi:hypothetical protein
VLQLTAPWRFDPSPYSIFLVEAETLAVSVPTEASAFDPSPYSLFRLLTIYRSTLFRTDFSHAFFTIAFCFYKGLFCFIGLFFLFRFHFSFTPYLCPLWDKKSSSVLLK